MTENEINQRRAGFMTAIGLLCKTTDPAIRDGILAALDSFGTDLYSEIESDQYLENEPATNPCPPGFYWDSMQKACIPIDEPT